MTDVMAIYHTAIVKLQRDSARRWARAWKTTAKGERAANDMLVPGWRWQSVRITELEEALRPFLSTAHECGGFITNAVTLDECQICGAQRRARELLKEDHVQETKS